MKIRNEGIKREIIFLVIVAAIVIVINMFIPKETYNIFWNGFAIMCLIIAIIVFLWVLKKKHEIQKLDDLDIDKLEKEMDKKVRENDVLK